MAEKSTEVWDLWYPQAGSTGMSFARGKAATGAKVMLVHAPPPELSVTVRTADGQILAEGQNLKTTGQSPIARLTRQANQIIREDIWPGQQDLGLPVILPGGEVGILKEWWSPQDHSEWRWQIELYNHR